MENLKGHYFEMFRQIKKNITLKDKNLVGFHYVKGSEFETGKKLLIYGRSVNGWPCDFNVDDLNEVAYEKIYNNILSSVHTYDDEEPLLWVHRQFGKKNIKAYNSKSGLKYNTAKSAFWRVSKNIVEKLVSSSDNNWYKNIAWSDLYKISYKSGGNPGPQLIKSIKDQCEKILVEEIKTLKPHYILFLTGYKGWFSVFERAFESDNIRFDNKLRNINNNDKIELTGSLFFDDHRAEIVVAPHPQGKKENDLIDEIIKVFTNA